MWPKLVGVSLLDEDREDDDETEERAHAKAAEAASTPWTATRHSPKNLDGDNNNNDPNDDDDGDDDSMSAGSGETATTLSSRVDVDTIERDVLRCTTHLLPPALLPHLRDGRVRALLRNRQERLAHLINKVLMNNENFWYYQGYHDVSSVFLATLGNKVSLRRDWARDELASSGVGAGGGANSSSDEHLLPYTVLSQVSRTYFRDFLHNNFGHLQTALRLTVFPLLARFDQELHDFLFDVEIPCSFCLPWILTWFARESGPAFVHRIFDACLASHPLFCLYLSVALVTHRTNRAWVLASEPDFSVVHDLLRSLPKNTFGRSSNNGGEGDDDDDEDDAYGWMDDHDDASVWETRTVDEKWLHQKIQQQEQHNVPHHRQHPHDSHGEGPRMSRDQDHHPDACHPVPFEELIATALDCMRIVPPHQLLDLAERYYQIYPSHPSGDSGRCRGGSSPAASSPSSGRSGGRRRSEMQDLLVDVPDIYFFRNNWLKWESSNYQHAGLGPDSPAVAAAGLAEGSLRRNRRKRKRRRRLLIAVAAAAVVSATGVACYWLGYVGAGGGGSNSNNGREALSGMSNDRQSPRIVDQGLQIVVEVDRRDLEGEHRIALEYGAAAVDSEEDSGVCEGSECLSPYLDGP